ncbi:GlxA family transcriptional regulator [Neptunomonas marina]|uniref:Helix-turn-helix domain-containing protein n=1 Tax=Neptunomonas marina TaxID=1815562 RepID=A0A437Q941_9GAMM|nr:helix-turn-helix domain-containing protein [Neptunomonas marina]RVU31025.1 helix-turn-helix domain-containing protein [Neptunomonas marina]
MTHSPIQIAVVAFEGISAFHLAVPGVVFRESRHGQPHFALTVCSAEGTKLNTSAGYAIEVQATLALLDQADIVVIPSWRNPDETPPTALLDALKRAHQRGAMIVGLCLGAYVVAEAGLLDGKHATTHWEYGDHFAKRFPKVQLSADVLYLQEERIVTSAGTAAGMDCCLYLVRELAGAEMANRIARRLVVPPHRQGGQAQFIESPVPSAERDHHLAQQLDWIRTNLHHPLDIDGLAEHAHMSRRSFTRHFRQLTGSSVSQWLLNERLTLAQQLLETSSYPIEAIAEKSGFGSTVSLRQQFRKRFGVSPQAWRRSFAAIGSKAN